MARPKGSKNKTAQTQKPVMEQLEELNAQRINEFSSETVKLINKYKVNEYEFKSVNREIEF